MCAGPLAAVVLALSVAGLVLAVTAADQARRERGPLLGWAADRAVVQARVRLIGDPQAVASTGPWRSDDRPRFAVRVELERVSGRGSTVTSGLPALVLGDQTWSGLAAGWRATLVGRLGRAELGEPVAVLVSAQGAPRQVTPGSWPWRVADRLRAGLRRACRGLPTDGGGLLPSLVVGDTSTVPAPLRADLQTAGLTHITAVKSSSRSRLRTLRTY